MKVKKAAAVSIGRTPRTVCMYHCEIRRAKWGARTYEKQWVTIELIETTTTSNYAILFGGINILSTSWNQDPNSGRAIVYKDSEDIDRTETADPRYFDASEWRKLRWLIEQSIGKWCAKRLCVGIET